MKKIYYLGVTILLIFSSFIIVHGADMWFRMMHGDEHQDALIIGTIIDEDSTQFTVKVNKVMVGSLEENYIQLNKDFLYYKLDIQPMVSDYVVLSVKKRFFNYNLVYGAFKANSNKYEELKIYTNNGSADVDALQTFINSGGEINDFFFNGDKVYYRYNGETVNINGVSLTYNSDNDEQSSINDTTTLSKQYKSKVLYNRLFYVGIVSITVISILFYFKRRSIT